MNQDLIDHPHAVSSWRTIRIIGGNMHHVLVVETDLETNGASPNYDQAAFDDLSAAVVQMITDSNHFDSAEIAPIRRPSP